LIVAYKVAADSIAIARAIIGIQNAKPMIAQANKLRAIAKNCTSQSPLADLFMKKQYANYSVCVFSACLAGLRELCTTTYTEVNVVEMPYPYAKVLREAFDE
jgi:hypothetical protein